MSQDIGAVKKRMLYRHFGSIFFKNLKLTTLVVVLPVALMAAICYIAYQNYHKSQISVYGFKTVRAFQSETDGMFLACAGQLNYLIADTHVSVFLQTGKGEQMFYNDYYLHHLLQMQKFTLDYLYDTYIYSERSGLVVSNMGIVTPENLYDTGWLGSYYENRGNRYWAEIRNPASASSLVPRRVISLYQAVTYGRNSNGAVILNIDFERFAARIAALRGEYDAALCIVDENGSLVSNLWGDPADYLTPRNWEKLSGGADYIQADRFILYRAAIARSPWQYVFAVPLSMYSAELASLRNMLVGMVIGGTSATVLVAVLISLRIYRPFRNIAAVLGKPLDYTETAAFNADEEGHIISAIKNTIHENAAISQELEERIALLRRAQSVALQTQISPHFLYNTLDAISWIAMRLTGGKNDASVMLGKLGSMLRYCLENAETLVPLHRELDNARTYLDLQMLRYKDKFTVEWDIAEEAGNVPVMKLLVQPLVENAIYHGIKPMSGPGVIGVSASLNGRNLEVCVWDNGAGIPPKALERLTAVIKNADLKQEQHIGLGNVSQRIRLFYGEGYGLDIEAAEGKGTKVTVTLPAGPGN